MCCMCCFAIGLYVLPLFDFVVVDSDWLPFSLFRCFMLFCLRVFRLLFFVNGFLNKIQFGLASFIF